MATIKRPAPYPTQSSSSSSSSHLRTSQVIDTGAAQGQTALSKLKIYIIQAKIDAKQISELVELVGNSDATLCTDPEESDVVITAISMRRRLERHISWDIAVSTTKCKLDKIYKSPGNCSEN